MSHVLPLPLISPHRSIIGRIEVRVFEEKTLCY
jgi:hypothetical protein